MVETGYGSQTGTSFEYAASRQDSLRREFDLYKEVPAMQRADCTEPLQMTS